MIAPIMALISPATTASVQDIENLADRGRPPATHSSRVRRRDRYVYLLLLRYLVVNLVAIGLLAAAWLQGWVERAYAADETRLVVLIAGLFAIGLLLCSMRVWRVSWELNQAHSPRPHSASRVVEYFASIRNRNADSRAMTAAALRAKLLARIVTVRHIASTLVLLGLIGTVVGFIIALSGVKPDAAGDVEAVTPMITTLINGMSVALYTTLVGAVLNIWLMVNYRMLATGTVNLLTAIVERGEADVGH